MLRDLGSDVRLAVRSLRADATVTMAAVLTLALGLGATTAVFSVANGLSLRPLPVRNPHDLVTVTSETALRHGFQAGLGWNYGMWEQLRQETGAFDGAFAWALQRLDLSDGGEMQPVNALVASAAMFETLGVAAHLGRTFQESADAGGGGPDGAVAVISHSLWQRRFGGAHNVIGSRLLIERVPVTVIGIAPEWFRGMDVGQPFDVAIPFGTDALIRGASALMNSERAMLLTVMLRLKPGQSVSQATAALRALQPRIIGANAPPFLHEPFVLVDSSTGISDRSRLRQQYQRPLVILSAVSAMVFVIVCVNVASLLLSRAVTRRRELGVRLALGAPRWRLATHAFAEALALAIAGAAGGVVFARWSRHIILSQLPRSGGPVVIDVSMDWRVFAFVATLTAIAVVLCGIASAWHSSRVAAVGALRDAGGGAGKHASGAVSSGLVMAHIALSIVLLSGAVLFVRTLNGLGHVPLGFEPRELLVVSVNTTPAAANKQEPGPFHGRALEPIKALPGVKAAAGSIWTPVGTGGGGLLTDARGRRAGSSVPVAFNFVTPSWFVTYGTPLRAGRDFDARDGANAQRVAIVNEAFRRSQWSGRDPVGSTIHEGPCRTAGCMVVGVVGDVVYGHSLRDAVPPTVYMPYAQSAGLAPPDAPFRITLRAAGDLLDVRDRVAARLESVDPRATFTFRRVEQDVSASLAQERLLAMLAVFFGAVGLAVSAVGVYGLSSYSASCRRAEIGIRLALGGQRHVVLRVVVKRIALFVGAGAAVGVLAALWLARFVAPLLYGLAPDDPVAPLTAATILCAVAGVAAWVPASRVTRTDPAQVLRQV